MFDVIIAGAGPAGAASAYFLTQAGKRVLVLEKQTLPRYKACGGGLSLRMLAKYFPFSFDPVIEQRIDRIAYSLGGRYQTMPLADPAMAMVMRERFDLHILNQSAAEVEPGTAISRVVEKEDAVEVETAEGKTYRGRYLIGADGASSQVARSLGLRRAKTLAAAIEVETPGTEAARRQFQGMPLFVFGELRNGYLWVFPKRDHLSVGIAGLHPKPGELRAVLKEVMARFDIPLDGAPEHGHPLPFYTGREPIATRRVLLAGDAAGLVDPLSGEGIRLAIKSARLACDALLADRPETYQPAVDCTIGTDNRLAHWLGKAFYRFPRACFALGVRNPLATAAVFELLSDKIGYPGLLLRLFGTIPYPWLLAAGRGLGLRREEAG